MGSLAKSNGPVQAFLAMAEFLGSPLASVVFLLALTAALVAVGVYVIGKVRAGLYKQEPKSSASLTKFRELHAKGDLNDAEFRTIKALLAERLQHDLNDTDEAS